MINNILLTGDTHGHVVDRILSIPLSQREPYTAIIILGDAGINFYLNKHDKKEKQILHDLLIQDKNYLYCVRGNHEQRPELLPNMISIFDEDIQGEIWQEPEFPCIKYLKDGGTYILGDYTTLVIGGAYSIDKYIRLMMGNVDEYDDDDIIIHKAGWFPRELLTHDEMARIAGNVINQHFDLVLTHTCPIEWEPVDLFINGVNQVTVDKTMEHFLSHISNIISYNQWCFGHYHADRQISDNINMFFTSYKNLEEIMRQDEE